MAVCWYKLTTRAVAISPEIGSYKCLFSEKACTFEGGILWKTEKKMCPYRKIIFMQGKENYLEGNRLCFEEQLIVCGTYCSRGLVSYFKDRSSLNRERVWDNGYSVGLGL